MVGSDRLNVPAIDNGQGGYITPAASEVPTASQRGGRIKSGPQTGKVAT